MSGLTAEKITQRDSSGNPLPVSVVLDEFDGLEASFISLTLGEFNEIGEDVDVSNTEEMSKRSKLTVDLLKKHLVAPSMTEDQWRQTPLGSITKLFKGLLKASGAEVPEKK